MPPQKVDDSLNQHKELLRLFCNFLFKDFSNIYSEVSQSAARSESIAGNESGSNVDVVVCVVDSIRICCFIRFMSSTICRASVNTVIQRTMEIMTDVVIGINGLSTKKMEVCYECLLEHMQRAINMLNVFVDRKGWWCWWMFCVNLVSIRCISLKKMCPVQDIKQFRMLEIYTTC